MITECDLGTSILIDRKGVLHMMFSMLSAMTKIIKKGKKKIGKRLTSGSKFDNITELSEGARRAEKDKKAKRA